MRPQLLAGALAAAAAMFLAAGVFAPSRGDSAAPEAATARGDDPKANAEVALAYLRRARDEADPAQLPRAEEALRRSLSGQPRKNFDAFVGMAALANARHDFSGSVVWSRRAIAANPYGAAAYGLLGDALFELGRVAAADAAYQKMLDLRPDVASYVRASYALQHRGRSAAAIGVLRLALQAAGPTGETAAWVRHQMGDVYAAMGDHTAAARQNRIGIELAPGYVAPTVGLAEAHIARGRLQEAIDLMEPSVRSLPSLEYLITLGDLYAATGQRASAEEQFAAAAEKLEAYRRAGVRPDADFLVFYADHDLRPAAAIREAREIYRDRPTPKTADALAWVLHARGRDAAAWRYSREALDVRVPDPGALAHAAAIERSLGERPGYAPRHGRGVRDRGRRAATAAAAR